MDVCINDVDLEAISLEMFQISTGKPYSGEDNSLKYCNDHREISQPMTRVFPMLGRINDAYEDAYFNPQEVKMLREECSRVKAVTLNPAADLGLRKLIYCCDEALRLRFSLMMLSD